MTRKKTNQLHLGSLSNKSSGSHYVMPPQNFPAPTTVTNATSTAPLDLTRLWSNSAQRPGCQDFLQHRSRGIGC
jgi:hypothetical protein